MSTIWKAQLSILDRQTVLLPNGCTPLSVQFQSNETLCMWLLVPDPNAERLAQTVGIYGTGHSIPDDAGRYVGTVQGGLFVKHNALGRAVRNEQFVWHVFWAGT